MARLPSWRDELPQSYAGARKWGTGINPIHSKKEGYEGRNLAPGVYEPGNTGLVSHDYGFMAEDLGADGMDTSFMEYHPNLGDPSIRGKSDMPSWNEGGWFKRMLKQGMNPREGVPEQIPNQTVGMGWINKAHGDELSSGDSDPSTVYVKTSEVQRDQMKNNNAAVLRGTDDARSEIPSRHVGMKVKEYPGGQRHEDMFPFQQSYDTRPWKYRGVGTGDPKWMLVNEMYVSEPLTREIPADVNQGVNETALESESDFEDGWYL